MQECKLAGSLPNPRLVNGRVLKSYNQFYNKRRAELQEALGHEGATARLERLTTKRTRRLNHYLHAASKTIIALLGEEGIGTLVIGKNLLWKQEIGAIRLLETSITLGDEQAG